MRWRYTGCSPVAGTEQTYAEERHETELADERFRLAMVVVAAKAEDLGRLIEVLAFLHGEVGHHLD